MGADATGPWTERVCVGREAELGKLAGLADAATASGSGDVALVSGPNGVGKTHFARELARRMVARGRAVYEGHCYAGAPPFACIADLLVACLEGLRGADADAELVRRGSTVLAGLRQGPSVEVRPSDERIQLFDETRAFLCGMAAAHPGGVLLLLHDVHLADPATRALIAHLARTLVRDPELPDEAAAGLRGLLVLIAPSFGDAFLLDGAVSIALEPWDAGTLRTYMAQPGFAELLVERTGGLPGRLETILAVARTEPEQLALATLGPAAAWLARCVALLGTPATPALLSALARPGDDAGLAIAELSRFPLAACHLDRAGTVHIAFAHDADRIGLVEALSPEDSASVHLAVARALDDVVGAAQADAVAEHFLRGGETAEGTARVIALVPHLCARFAHERALALLKLATEAADVEDERTLRELTLETAELAGDYAVALEACDWLIDATLPRDPDRAGLLAARGRLLLLQGNVLPAADCLRRAVKTARQAGKQEYAVEALAALAEAYWQQSPRGDAAAAATEVLGMPARGDRAARARMSALKTLGKCHLDAGEYDAAASSFRLHLAAAGQRGMPRESASALVNLGIVALRAGRHAEARTHYHDALAIAEHVQDLRLGAYCAQNLGVLAQWRRDYRAAFDHYHAAIARFKRLGQRALMAWVAIDLGDVYLDVGDHLHAVAMADLATRLLGDAPNVNAQVILGHFRGRLALVRGDFEESARLLGTAERLADEANIRDERDLARLYLAELHCRQGNARDALDTIDRTDTSSSVRLEAQREGVRAHALLVAGRHAEARLCAIAADEAWAAQADDEGRLQALLVRAQAAAALGDRAEAQRVRDEARNIDISLRERVPAEHAATYGREPLRQRLYVRDDSERRTKARPEALYEEAS